jgi:hypothetical protein
VAIASIIGLETGEVLEVSNDDDLGYIVDLENDGTLVCYKP